MTKGEVFYEVMCRGERRCGSFVSCDDINACPKCGSEKILKRMIRKSTEQLEKGKERVR